MSAIAITIRRRRSSNGSMASPCLIRRPAQRASSSPSTNHPSTMASANGLAAEGVVYVPEDCVSHPGCRLHITLHGCDQARETVGDAFIKESGFARYADTNRLVVLFPQIAGECDEPAWLLGLVGL